MADKNVAMFIQENGERVQVGWASPAVDGVRTWEFLPGFEGTKVRDVSFEDDEISQKVAEEQEALRDQVDESDVEELDNGGTITDFSDEEEEGEYDGTVFASDEGEYDGTVFASEDDEDSDEEE